MFVLAAFAACDVETGRDGMAAGPSGGPKADDANGGGSAELTPKMIEVLDQISERLGDPQEHTSADDNSDGDGTGPDPKWSCLHRCGEVEMGDNNCACHWDCEYADEEGCCEDFIKECTAPDDWDDDPADDGSNEDDGDDGDGGGNSGGDVPPDESCYELCGLSSSSGNCYCDDACDANGDCCADYAQQCASAPPHEPGAGSDVAAPTDPVALSEACLKIIDDDEIIRRYVNTRNDLDKEVPVHECLAASMVVWNQTSGLYAASGIVVCLGEGTTENLLGAAKAHIREKRSDLEICTHYTDTEVAELVEKPISVPVYLLD